LKSGEMLRHSLLGDEERNHLAGGGAKADGRRKLNIVAMSDSGSWQYKLSIV